MTTSASAAFEVDGKPFSFASVYHEISSMTFPEDVSVWGDKEKRLVSEVYNGWLWGTRAAEPVVDFCGDMNLNHGLGLLNCVIMNKIYTLPKDNGSICDLLPHTPLVHLSKRPVLELNQRQLFDQVECLQLSWGVVVGNHEHLPGRCELVISLLMARLGHLTQRAYSASSSDLNFDDYKVELPRSACAAAGSGGGGGGGASSSSIISPLQTTPVIYCIVTRKFIRRLVCLFLVLLRSLKIITDAQIADDLEEKRIEDLKGVFQQHHVESSEDTFMLLQQMVHLAPGMRLVYRTEFAGMYNDVSQVIYCHYPNFSRTPALPLNLISESSIQTLPLVCQLLPQIPIYYDDDDYIQGLTLQKLKFATMCKVDGDKYRDLKPDYSSRARRRLKKVRNNNDDDDDEGDEEEEDYEDEAGNNNNNNKHVEYVTQFAWLISCATIFLLETTIGTSATDQVGWVVENKILVSPTPSLLPLLHYYDIKNGSGLVMQGGDSNNGGAGGLAAADAKLMRKHMLSGHAHTEFII